MSTARLSEAEKLALLTALAGNVHPAFIFGSRADAAKKGGDIDLLVLARGLSSEKRFALSVQIAIRFRAQLDQKLDVVVFDEQLLSEEESAFLTSVRERGLVRIQN